MKLQGRVLDQMAGSYALGLLATRARRRFETLLQQDVAVRRSWQQWNERLATLAPDLPPVRPPDGIWARIEAQIAPPPSRWQSLRRWWPLVALVLAAALAVLVVRR